MTRLTCAAICLLGAVVGCSGGGKAAGTEGGPCYGNGTCNSGLVCLSNLCVAPGGPLDGGLDGGLDGAVDGGLDGAVAPCDVLSQTGCDAGQACILNGPNPDGGVSGADGGTYGGTCRAAGSQATGQPCSVDMRCVAGDQCLATLCLAYCDPALADPYCFGPIGGVGVTLPSCNPLLQDCAAGWSCIVGQISGGADPASSCLPPFDSNTSVDGDACNSVPQSCDTPGLECVPEGPMAAPSFICRPFCDTTSPNACSAAQVKTCKSLSSLLGMSYPGIPANWGICTTGTSP